MREKKVKTKNINNKARTPSFDHSNIKNKEGVFDAFAAMPTGGIIAWNFRHMDDSGRWGCSIKCLEEFKDRLIHFEGQRVIDIFQKGNRHNHVMRVENVCKTAQDRLDKILNINTEQIYQLELTQITRLWGYLVSNVFHIIWIDRDHSVCPTKK